VEAVEEKGSLLHHSEHAVLDPTRLRKLRHIPNVRRFGTSTVPIGVMFNARRRYILIQWLSGLLDFEHMIL
jgi:hypothetical protein